HTSWPRDWSSDVCSSDLKSMIRYIFLWPPPRKRVHTMPWWFRPPLLGLGWTSDFSGFFLRSVISAKSLTVPCRRPAVTGLYCRMPMCHPIHSWRRAARLSPQLLRNDRRAARRHAQSALEELDSVFRVQCDNRLL